MDRTPQVVLCEFQAVRVPDSFKVHGTVQVPSTDDVSKHVFSLNTVLTLHAVFQHSFISFSTIVLVNEPTFVQCLQKFKD